MIPTAAATLRILLAEDDVDDQELLAEAFGEVDPGVSLLSFTTGRSFLRYVEQLPDEELPDLILVDYNIPEINGAEILKYLASHQRYAPIVKLVWSTSSAFMYETSCLALGASAYLVKPSNVSGLTSLAKRVIELAAAQ